MNELSLFTGVGGGLLGSLLLGWQTIGAVEIEKYPCRVLEQRQKDGILNAFPIWNMDIREFNKRVASIYKGMVDVITAGFPCQPFSVAGKQEWNKDDRNLWPETIRAIETIEPKHVLLENVPGIRKYLPVVIRDLRRAGYTVKRPAIIAAAAVGTGHIRNRVWIYAYLDKEGRQNDQRLTTSKEIIKERSTVGMADEKIPANANQMRELQSQGCEQDIRGWISNSNWWKAEPRVVRVVHGVPYGMDRIGALGNAQVPQCMAIAWKILAEEEV